MCALYEMCTTLSGSLTHTSDSKSQREASKLQVSEVNQMFTRNLWPDGDFENSLTVFAYLAPLRIDFFDVLDTA